MAIGVSTIVGTPEPTVGTTKHGITVDKGLVELVELVHDLGYDTFQSCSGLKRDHPGEPDFTSRTGYLAFFYPETRDELGYRWPIEEKKEFAEMITRCARRAGLDAERDTTFFIPTVTVRAPGLPVVNSIETWHQIREEANVRASLPEHSEEIGVDEWIRRLDLRNDLIEEIVKERYGGWLELSDDDVAMRWKSLGECLKAETKETRFAWRRSP